MPLYMTQKGVNNLWHFDAIPWVDAVGGASMTNSGAILGTGYQKFGVSCLACYMDAVHRGYAYKTIGDIDREKRFSVDFWIATDFGAVNLGDAGTSIDVLRIKNISGNKYSLTMELTLDSSLLCHTIITLINSNGTSYSFTSTTNDISLTPVHIAIVRDSDTTVKYYRAGILINTFTVAATYEFDSGTIYVGNYIDLGTATYPNELAIDELRLASGVKFSAAFTPPTVVYDL